MKSAWVHVHQLLGLMMNLDRYDFTVNYVDYIVNLFAIDSCIYFQCSKACNGGIQSRTMFCTSHYRGQIINDRYCEHLPKESLERTCNTHECPKWQFGDESAVSIQSIFNVEHTECCLDY